MIYEVNDAMLSVSWDNIIKLGVTPACHGAVSLNWVSHP